jgi:hypothetical protein
MRKINDTELNTVAGGFLDFTFDHSPITSGYGNIVTVGNRNKVAGRDLIDQSVKAKVDVGNTWLLGLLGSL